MSVFVDSSQSYGKRVGRLGANTRWCHMRADTLDELHAMARLIGMRREWFQDKPGNPHYDLTDKRRSAAIAAGAIPVTNRELARHFRPRGQTPNPGSGNSELGPESDLTPTDRINQASRRIDFLSDNPEGVTDEM